MTGSTPSLTRTTLPIGKMETFNSSKLDIKNV